MILKNLAHVLGDLWEIIKDARKDNLLPGVNEILCSSITLEVR